MASPEGTTPELSAEERDLWSRFAAGALSRQTYTSVVTACATADAMLKAYRERCSGEGGSSDLLLLLQAQRLVEVVRARFSGPRDIRVQLDDVLSWLRCVQEDIRAAGGHE